MEYSDMNRSSWSSYLPRFKNLVRPEGAGPAGEAEESVESARDAESAKMALATVSSALPDLFGGVGDWYSNQDEWVLTNLGRALSPSDEQEILSELGAGTPDALIGLLDFMSNRVGAWREAASQSPPESDGSSTPSSVSGTENTSNWQANRVPGTYYYAVVGDRYVYSDMTDAPAGEWAELAVRVQRAAEQAQSWGNNGWFYTRAERSDLYGGEYVYAADRNGPWMTEEQAKSQVVSADGGSRQGGRYSQVEQVLESPEWARAYDTQDGVWKFARMNGSELPGDDAEWAENDTSSDEDEMEDVMADPEDIQSIMDELMRENPEYADVDEETRRRFVTDAVNEALAQQVAEEGER